MKVENEGWIVSGRVAVATGLVAAALIAFMAHAVGQVSPAPDVVFFDDFSGPDLNRANWNVMVSGRVVNNEQQAYVDSAEVLRTSRGTEVSGAENGALTVMCGGDPPAYARGEKIIAAYAKACTLMGAPGSGQLAKMVNQICIAGLVQGLAEGIHFAKKSGLDIEKLIATISKGAAQSWQMENRYKTMAPRKFDFGFAVDGMRKDLSICLGEARKNGANLPIAALVDQFYSQVQKMGGKRWDTSSLIALLDR